MDGKRKMMTVDKRMLIFTRSRSAQSKLNPALCAKFTHAGCSILYFLTTRPLVKPYCQGRRPHPRVGLGPWYSLHFPCASSYVKLTHVEVAWQAEQQVRADWDCRLPARKVL